MTTQLPLFDAYCACGALLEGDERGACTGCRMDAADWDELAAMWWRKQKGAA